MNLQETAALLSAVAMLYPGRVTPDVEAVPLWASMLPDIGADEATRALRVHAATSPHPPCVADIRRLVAEQKAPAVDVAAAWDEIRRAIGRCGRDAEPGSLRPDGTQRPPWSSPRVAAAVQAIGWREICNTLDDDLPTLRAQLRQALEGSTATAQRDANLLPLEAAHGEAAALVGRVAQSLSGAKLGGSGVKP